MGSYLLLLMRAQLFQEMTFRAILTIGVTTSCGTRVQILLIEVGRLLLTTWATLLILWLGVGLLLILQGLTLQ